MHACNIVIHNTKMNLSTVKWAQWDKTQYRELLGLFICTIVAHNIAQNRPDNFPCYPPNNHHCSDDVYLREMCATHVLPMGVGPFAFSISYRWYATRQNVSKFTAFWRSGSVWAKISGEGVVPREYFLVSRKLDTFWYLRVQTAPCYLFWHNTGV